MGIGGAPSGSLSIGKPAPRAISLGCSPPLTTSNDISVLFATIAERAVLGALLLSAEDR